MAATGLAVLLALAPTATADAGKNSVTFRDARGDTSGTMHAGGPAGKVRDIDIRKVTLTRVQRGMRVSISIKDLWARKSRPYEQKFSMHATVNDGWTTSTMWTNRTTRPVTVYSSSRDYQDTTTCRSRPWRRGNTVHLVIPHACGWATLRTIDVGTAVVYQGESLPLREDHLRRKSRFAWDRI